MLCRRAIAAATPEQTSGGGGGSSGEGYSDSGMSECERLTMRYQDSQACFAPFRLANGAVRKEAYRYCTPVADPSAKCGAPSY